MKTRASCRHLTHRYPIYLGCTLSDLSLLGSVCFVIVMSLSVFFAFLITTFHWLPLQFGGAFFVSFLVLFMLGLVVSKKLAKFIGGFKERKPQGYLILKLRGFLHLYFGLPLPLMARQGIWLNRRKW